MGAHLFEDDGIAEEHINTDTNILLQLDARRDNFLTPLSHEEKHKHQKEITKEDDKILENELSINPNREYHKVKDMNYNDSSTMISSKSVTDVNSTPKQKKKKKKKKKVPALIPLL